MQEVKVKVQEVKVSPEEVKALFFAGVEGSIKAATCVAFYLVSHMCCKKKQRDKVVQDSSKHLRVKA